MAHDTCQIQQPFAIGRPTHRYEPILGFEQHLFPADAAGGAPVNAAYAGLRRAVCHLGAVRRPDRRCLVAGTEAEPRRAGALQIHQPDIPRRAQAGECGPALVGSELQLAIVGQFPTVPRICPWREIQVNLEEMPSLFRYAKLPPDATLQLSKLKDTSEATRVSLPINRAPDGSNGLAKTCPCRKYIRCPVFERSPGA